MSIRKTRKPVFFLAVVLFAGSLSLLSVATAGAQSLPAAGSGSLARQETPQSAKPEFALPQASLAAQASRIVPQDTVKIYLAAQVSDADRSQVDTRLAQLLNAATEKAKGHSGISVSTRNYSVWPNIDKKGAISGWRGQAELVLESQNFDAASTLAARLSEQMSIARVAFSLSPDARQQHEQSLLEEAVGQFRQRAARLAGALGYPAYGIANVALDQGSAGFYPAPRMMAAMPVPADDAGVTLEAGTETVTVSLNGSVYLLANTGQHQSQSSE